MKDGDVVKRNGNYFKIKKDNHNHYYTALILGNARVSAWHRTTVKSLSENYEHVKIMTETRLNLTG